LRLSKFIALCGISSRRKSEDLIRSGIVKVNNVVIYEPQFKVLPERDIVIVYNNRVNQISSKIYIALNKPVRYLSDLSYNDDRSIARSLINIDAYLFPVGRLDYYSEGLMVFTNDGDFAYKIMHPKYEVEKEYQVKFKGILNNEDIKRIKKGFLINGYIYKINKIILFKESFKNSWYKVTVSEGRNRMIRIIGDQINHKVIKLKRLRIGNIKLGNLKLGEYRFLKKEDI
jgi:23S rRNA pseudouridine2605 synthase